MNASSTEHTNTVTTGRLVAAGNVAGPLIVVAWAVQAVTRDGYDVTRHPMSLLALGDGGLVQIANFIVTGLLVIALGFAFRRLFADGIGHRWTPSLVQLTGVGLVAAGVFTTDPGAGFPAGATEGMPDYSWHGILHEVAFVVVMLSWTATMVLLYRRYRREANRTLLLAAVGVVVVVLILSGFPHADSFPIRTVLAAGIQLAFLAAVARLELPRSVHRYAGNR